ncbi:MAG TPA: hypothetical protein PLN70_09700 [Kiritimatiellia bacterium]|nr:hypothetical protein [Kiritimatiellia bacterium]
MRRYIAWFIGMLTITATTAMAANFVKQNVGAPGGWAGTIAGTELNGTLYTVEATGSLYATAPANGAWTRVGKADFANVVFLFAVGESLVAIEKDGSLYLIQPQDGSWRRSGPAGGWANTVAGAVLGQTLYTVENSGTLYASDPSAGTWRQVGGPDFAAVKQLFAVGNRLVSIEKSGNLYLINPADGSWERTGDFAAWEQATAGVALGQVLYTAEQDGALVATDTASGTRVPVGAGFAGVQFLFLPRNLLCGIDANGNFFHAASQGDAPAASAPAPTATPEQPALSTAEDEAQNDPARAGALTFQFMGQWVGDTAPLEQDPEFLKQKEAAPEMVQQVLALMQGMKMSVTLDGVTMEVMGEKAGPFGYSVIAAHDDILVIETQDGPKAGVRSRLTFRDARHVQVEELTPAGRAMFFKKP